MAAKIQRVQLTRALRHRGEDYGIGSVIDFDLPTAQELRGANKVEFVGNEAKLVKTEPSKPQRAPRNRGTALVDALVAQVAELKAMVEKLTPVKPAAKEKASAN